jgi:phosphatidylglycerophosphatase A
LKNLLFEIYKTISWTIGTFLGIGLIPIMPGTFASIAAALIWISIPEYYFYNSSEKSIYFGEYFIFLGILIICSYFFVYICKECEKKFGKDAGCIVIDEVVGYMVAVMFLPRTMMVAIYALILFRIFDITKPFFINRLQKLPHGWGVMLDDVLAGVYTNIILHVILIIKPNFIYIGAL